jgi:dihydrodipicolinate synthase/N-acetylneuraminate lyase
MEALWNGLVIPAHPLALTQARRLDERRQRALTRYYAAAGAGGLAVGVHTTQFAIRDPGIDLLEPVLRLAAETLTECESSGGNPHPHPLVRIAGICGGTRQAVGEAGLARACGYHAGLLSLAALKDADEYHLIEHCRTVAQVIPLMGFYLQPAAGGRLLSQRFWRRFAEIPNVIAIKIAPFNRYQTFDVIRAVAEAGRAGDIALYTGNDDHIVLDLLTRWQVAVPDGAVDLHFAGGLLGHWACWTRSAVALLAECLTIRRHASVPASLLTLAEQVTDCNAAFFDAAHQFAGCIAGIHQVLYRQGLLANTL